MTSIAKHKPQNDTKGYQISTAVGAHETAQELFVAEYEIFPTGPWEKLALKREEGGGLRLFLIRKQDKEAERHIIDMF